MNLRLASAVDLQLQMKHAHWYVKGWSFIGLHELSDKIDNAVEGYGTRSPSALCSLKVSPNERFALLPAARCWMNIRSRFRKKWRTSMQYPQHCLPLAKKHALPSGEVEELNDADTADLFTEVSHGIDKGLWFVEAHSQAPT